MGSRWLALSFELPASRGEEVSGCLAGLSRGTEFVPGPAGRTRLRVCLRESARPEEAKEAARVVLGQMGLDAEAARLRIIEIEDERWVERYQASLQPFALGGRFVVDPTGGGIAATERRSIRLVPGRAFGTGEHATTQICAEQLERRVGAGSRWLDIGCGSAILSVVACACGAEQVLGLDDDPEALRVAGKVLRDNPDARGVALVRGSVDAAARAVWDGIVTNISMAFLLREAAGLAARLKAGGWLIASGFLRDDLPAVVGALDRCGLAKVEHDERDGWAGLVARRAGATRQTRAGLRSSESGATDLR